MFVAFFPTERGVARDFAPRFADALRVFFLAGCALGRGAACLGSFFAIGARLRRAAGSVKPEQFEVLAQRTNRAVHPAVESDALQQELSFRLDDLVRLEGPGMSHGGFATVLADIDVTALEQIFSVRFGGALTRARLPSAQRGSVSGNRELLWFARGMDVNDRLLEPVIRRVESGNGKPGG